MKITALETVQLGPQSNMPGLLFVRVHTDAGLIGLGETFYLPDACREVIHRDIAPTLLGEDARQIERHWRTFGQAYSRVTGLGAEMRALSAVDVALWDLAGQAAGVPLHQLLGGPCFPSLPHYNTCAGPLYAAGAKPLRAGHGSSARSGMLDDLHAALHDPAGLVRSLLDDGIGALKVWPFDRFAARHGGQRIAPQDLAEGVRTVAEIRAAGGPEIDIMIEGHGLWALGPAVEIAQALAPYRISWIEDMVLATDVRVVAELRRRSPVPVCGSEYLNTRIAYRDMLCADALDVVMVDPTWAGGITESRKIAALADAFGRPVTFHDCTGPVTLMAGIQLAFSAPNAIYQETVRAFNRTFYADLVEGMPVIAGPAIEPPAAPGIGMRLREELLADPSVRCDITRFEKETCTDGQH